MIFEQGAVACIPPKSNRKRHFDFDQGFFDHVVQVKGASFSGNSITTEILENNDYFDPNNIESVQDALDFLTGVIPGIKHRKSQGVTQNTTHRASKLKTNNGDVNITSTLGDVTLRAAEVESGNDVNIAADNGQVQLLTAKYRDFHQHTRSKSNAVWQSSADTGHEHETVRHTILTGEGNFNITSADGVTVEYRATGNLDHDIAQLAQAPGLGWMAELQNDPNIDWVAVREVYRKIFNHSTVAAKRLYLLKFRG